MRQGPDPDRMQKKELGDAGDAGDADHGEGAPPGPGRTSPSIYSHGASGMHPPGEDPCGAIGVILGSAMGEEVIQELALQPVDVETPYGTERLFEGMRADGVRMLALHRHGYPHQHLPHTIPVRAQIWALRMRGCGALVLNSSVGVLDPAVPLFTPLVPTDLLMPDNRLPDGSVCTLFTPEAMAASPEVRARAGHLVLTEGIFSPPLRAHLTGLIERAGASAGGASAGQRASPGVTVGTGAGQQAADATRAGNPGADPLIFVYAPGPRTKTPAENRYWRTAGGHVNSMSVGPEAVLACEAGIPCAALVVGHKPSTERDEPLTHAALTRSLTAAREAATDILLAFLQEGRPVPAGNLLYQF
jgi:5'-methylthioadenosine phosphorylase